MSIVLPEFLLEETTIREGGAGPVLSLGGRAGATLLVTLGITRIIEQESLDISIWGSSDGTDWGSKPLAAFPQKFYCGTYQIVLDLSLHPDVAHVRAQWQANRWGKGDAKPLFAAYLFLQAMDHEAAAVAC
jgi:hypothetical protein